MDEADVVSENQQSGRAAEAEDHKPASGSQEGKYLTFELASEHYGLDILKVREIIGMMDITHVPQTPAFVKGLINLRGKVIPVVDLRLKFGMPEMDYTERTAIIVVEIETAGGAVQMGIVVDTVSEVAGIGASDIEDAPQFGARVRTDYIIGMAKTRERVVILLDIDTVLTDEELTLVGG